MPRAGTPYHSHQRLRLDVARRLVMLHLGQAETQQLAAPSTDNSGVGAACIGLARFYPGGCAAITQTPLETSIAWPSHDVPVPFAPILLRYRHLRRGAPNSVNTAPGGDPCIGRRSRGAQTWFAFHFVPSCANSLFHCFTPAARHRDAAAPHRCLMIRR